MKKDHGEKKKITFVGRFWLACGTLYKQCDSHSNGRNGNKCISTVSSVQLVAYRHDNNLAERETNDERSKSINKPSLRVEVPLICASGTKCDDIARR
jgi:hypothetical protein